MTLPLHGAMQARLALNAAAESCYASAYQALENDDIDNAQKLFAIFALFAPRDERAWVGLGVTMERRTDHRSAAAMYAMGCALAPDSAWCALGHARALRVLGNRAGAERALDQAESATTNAAMLQLIENERNEHD